jgi:chromate transport protein ChrA
MEFGFNIFSYLLAMVLAGIGSFGGGLGGTNIIRDFAINWWSIDELEFLSIASLSQFNGYSQGIMLAGYFGGKEEIGLGIFGIMLGITAFMLPSVLTVIIILKIGEKLYKSGTFKYSLIYMNLLGTGLICVMLWQYIYTVFSIDMIILIAVAGLAFYLNVFLNVKPSYIMLSGVVIGIIWGLFPAMRNM